MDKYLKSNTNIADCEGVGKTIKGEVYKIDQEMLEHLGEFDILSRLLVQIRNPNQPIKLERFFSNIMAAPY